MTKKIMKKGDVYESNTLRSFNTSSLNASPNINHI